jgi:hypothetical protein
METTVYAQLPSVRTPAGRQAPLSGAYAAYGLLNYCVELFIPKFNRITGLSKLGRLPRGGIPRGTGVSLPFVLFPHHLLALIGQVGKANG